MIEKLIDRMFAARNAAHVAHWKTKSLSEHEALGKYHDEVIEKVDHLAEAYQGTFGVVGNIKGQVDDVKKMIHDDIIWLNDNRKEIAKGVAALENIIDDLTALHMTTLYKLERLK